MLIQNVVVVGGGVLGSQIAYQCAYAGFHVITYLRSEASVERAKPKVQRLHGIYHTELEAAKNGARPVSRGLVLNQDPEQADYDALLKRADEAFTGFRYETELAAAVADADLVIEALAEQPEAKRGILRPAPAAAAGENDSCDQLQHTTAQHAGRCYRTSGEIPITAFLPTISGRRTLQR